MTVEETIDASIEKLIAQLVTANRAEAAQIHTRIAELKSLKEKRVAT